MTDVPGGEPRASTMGKGIPPGRRGGRPRDAALDTRVLNAAFGLLAEKGLAGFKSDDLAARAGVPKSTIYRRWPSLIDLAVDAVDAALGDRTVPTTDDPLADLGVIVQRAHSLFTGQPVGTTIPHLALQLLDRPEAARSYRERVIAPLRDAAIDAVRRAEAAGMWRGPDAATSIDMTIGTLLYRLTYLGHTPSLDEAFAIADQVAGRPLPRPGTGTSGGLECGQAESRSRTFQEPLTHYP